jgi:hypothetical protein
VQERLKGFILGSIVGGMGGLLVGATLVALFWTDMVGSIRRLVRRALKRDEQVNFEILLQ